MHNACIYVCAKTCDVYFPVKVNGISSENNKHESTHVGLKAGYYCSCVTAVKKDKTNKT